MTRASAMALLAWFLAGCAKVPDVTLSYYLATWKTRLLVTQTVGCSEDKERLAWRATCTATTTYVSETHNPTMLIKFPLKGPDRSFADNSLAMAFTEDGRLKGINQGSTGQGETIIKASVALAPLLGFREAPSRTTRDACEVIKSLGKGAPITLTYDAEITAKNFGSPVDLNPTPESEGLYNEIVGTGGALPHLRAIVGRLLEQPSRATWNPPQPAGDYVPLTLQNVGSFELTIQAGTRAISDGIIVIVPEESTYTLPIPKAALFGNQTFGIGLSDVGAITNISYGKTSGAAGALNSAGAIVAPSTSAARAADLKAEADLIAQQQRLVLCETRPEQCK